MWRAEVLLSLPFAWQSVDYVTYKFGNAPSGQDGNAHA
jgi:hypothetical protein